MYYENLKDQFLSIWSEYKILIYININKQEKFGGVASH